MAGPGNAARPLPVEAGWARALEPVADRIHAMGDFLSAENAAGHGYLPAGEDVLRAFTTPFDDVRVLIVGQDPYPTPGHPMGLSFSVHPDVRPLPRSLANIYREYESDLGYDRATPTEQVEALTCRIDESTMSLTAETAARELRELIPPADMQVLYVETLSVLDEIAATNFAEACPDLDTILDESSEACNAAIPAMYRALRSLDTQLNAWTPYL